MNEEVGRIVISSSSSTDGFLAGSSEMAALMRDKNWSRTPLGPIENWPQSLRTTVSLCLAANFPINIIWGPQNIQIYNDGYRVVCGEAHPKALGEGYDVTWASAWPAIGEPLERARAGETSFIENQSMFLTRNGHLEETFFTFSLSPIRDESGGIGGVFHPVTETTATMLAERRTRTLRDFNAQIGTAADEETLAAAVIEVLSGFPFDLPFLLWYEIKQGGTQYRLTGHHGVSRGSAISPEAIGLDDDGPWPARKAAQTLQPVVVEGLAELIGSTRCGPYEEAPDRALVLPVRIPGVETPPVLLIAGVSSRLPFNDHYRGFYELLASALSAAFSAVRARENERRRAQALAEIDLVVDVEPIPEQVSASLDLIRERRETALRASNAELERLVALTEARSRVFELAVRDTPLGESLEAIVTAVEALSSSNVLASILIADADAKHLRHGASPSLPAAYSEAIDGIAVGLGVGSCGTAAHTRVPVYVSDIAVDPLWTDFRELALSHGLRACWSIPILSGDDTVLGTFAMYYREPREPNSADLDLADYIVKAAALVIERTRAGERLRASESRLSLSEESLRLSTEAAEVGTWDLDIAHNVLTWSDRTKAMFGISPETPCSMADFYAGLHPSDREATTAAFAQALDPAIRSTYDVEYRTVGKEDGVIRWVAAKGKGLFDEDGRCGRAIGTAIDITAHKRLDARRLALNELGGRIRDSTDAADLAFAAAEILGRTLGVSRAGYGTIDTANETITIDRDWNAPGIKSLAGVLHFRDYGSYIEDLKVGRTVAISDAFADPRTADAADALVAISARSFVNMPLTEAGGFVALLYLNHKTERTWPEDELEFVREIAERTRTAIARLTAEAELRGSQGQLEAIANSIDQMIWSTQPDGFHDYYNQRWYEFTGVPQGSTDGDAWNGMFHPEDQERAFARWRHCLETGEAYHIEYRLRHRSGQYRWVLGRAQPVRGRTGRIKRWYGTCTDIHDMVAAREVLARSREDLEDLVRERSIERNQLWSLTSLLVAVVGFDSVIREANPAWPALLGWSEAELVGRSYVELLHPEDIDRTLAWAADLAAGQDVPDLENRFVRKDGAYRCIEWTVTAGDGAFHSIGRDVTEQREQAAALRTTEEALRQSQKMEAVGQLTGGIAHDFNNMLGVVIGSLDLLGRRMDGSDARSRRYVESASEGAKRAALLTKRLLAFSRQQPLKPEPIDANRLVAGMSELIRGSIGREINLETVLASGLWRANADPNQLENVLLNLAVNARDAMPEGGRLTIETQNAHLDGRYVAAHLGVSAGQYVLIAVTDTGTGMPDEVIAKAFDPFFTTKEVGKGTGLGLSQVYGFVKQSGGHVKIYSEPGDGTTIKIYLPRLIGAEHDVASESAGHELSNGDLQEVVLVVEDEPAMRQLSIDALTELGYRVLEADGAAAALRMIDTHPEIGLLFTDIVMPEVNGAKLAEEVRLRRPELRVLFTTGYTRNAVVHNGVLDAGVELIGKPFTIEELAVKVREVLDKP